MGFFRLKTKYYYSYSFHLHPIFYLRQLIMPFNFTFTRTHLIHFCVQETVLSRLAAVHRGASRALQTLVHHLGDFALATTGLPRCYHELVVLLHQLERACSQVKVETETDGIMKALDEVQVTSKIAELCVEAGA